MRKKTAKTFKSFRLHHKILFSLVGVTGVILIWRGIWTFFDATPILNHPVASLIMGFILVVLLGMFFKLL